ncbi:MAG: DNA internalization-related competence protein ComEC/Rec2 [Deltaproteobacteria bacterium]|nr:DNA internalization-related competence protein ComEC/Rec2 [Deltaproteobacteria bacterium]
MIPVLISFIGGILIGHIGLSHYQSLILPLFLLITSIMIASFLIPTRLRFPCFLLLFLLAGVLLVLTTNHPSDLLPLAQERKRVIMEGTVLKPPKIAGNIARIEVRAERLFFQGQVKQLKEKVLVSIFNHVRDFSPGERIRFPARLRPFKNFNNPGRYNYELAMKQRGLSCAVSVSDGRHIIPMGRGQPGLHREIIETARGPIRNLFRERLSPQNQALFRALILGEKQGIDPELREPFNIAGVGHILAVSGLHIGLVAWLAFLLSRWFLSLFYSLTLKTDIRRLAAIITCFPVVAYTCLAGFQISSQRAMIMVLAYLFSIILGREKEVWSTLALAAFIVLALNPYALYGISFQLSFTAVIGILWLGPVIYKRIPFPPDQTRQKNIFYRLYLYLSGLIVVTLSAIIFLLPITSFYFHRVSIVSIAANLMVVPILGIWIIPLGLLSSLSLPFSSFMANLFLQMGAWGLEWMIGIIRFWAHFNWAAFWVVTPNVFEIILFYALIFFGLFIMHRPWAKVGLSLVLILILADISYWIYETRFNQHLRVTYLDVGQGNSTLIQFPGKKRMLIDGGGFARGEFDLGRMVVAPFILQLKILRIDYIVLSHPQSDHMNGLRFIASHFQPEEFWYNGDKVETPSFKELMKILEREKIKILLPAGLSDKRDIAGVKIKILHPLTDRKGTRSFDRRTGLNNNSLVLKISYQGKSLLFPGDLEKHGEEMVISNAGPVLESDIMLAPHHGSKSSCSKPFLRIVNPDICIISSGSGNYFGFPHPDALRRLRNIRCRIIRINKKGAIRLSLGQNKFKIKHFLD